MKRWILFGVFVVAVLGFFMAISGDRAAYIPEDDDHRGLKAEAPCLDCHSRGGEAPLGEKHPPKDECFKCHKRKPGRK